MRNTVILLLVISCALGYGGGAKVHAQSSDLETVNASNVPHSLLFIGLGAGLGIDVSGEQSVYNKGISSVFNMGTLIANGTADGPPVTPTLQTKSDCIPLAQLGYFQHFENSACLWGVKNTYNYIGTTLSEKQLVIPQFGTSSAPNVSTFNGFSVTRSYDVFIDHQFTFVPFVGRSFRNGFVYAGAGPSLSRVGASLNGVIGFATINGQLLDISGRPQTAADTQWAFGVAASAGCTYFITPFCFLGIDYTFSNPFPYKFHHESPFQNNAYSPLVFSGTLIGDYTANVNTHSITMSVNFGF